MAIPSTGAISLDTIQTEFGGVAPTSLSEYYAGGVNVPPGTSGTNGAVPSSGAISFSHFYGTSSVVYALPSGSFNDTQFSPSDASLTFTLYANSLWTVITSDFNTLSTGHWITPNTGSTGHYVKFTPTWGTFSTGTAGTWLQLNTPRSVSVLQSTFGAKVTTFTCEVAGDAIGSDIKITRTGISFEAFVESSL